MRYSVESLKAAAGTHLGRSRWMDISQERIDRFAEATGDHQWIHVDPERAKAGPFGTTIAHGYLTLSLAVPLLAELVEVEGAKLAVNYGTNRVRFVSPVPVGSRIRASAVLGSVEDVAGGVQAVIDTTFEIEGSERPACVAEVIYRFYI